MKKIYLDYAASTPVDERVWQAMKPYFTDKYGNPGSLHSFGQEAIAAVDLARETTAKTIGADFGEIVFTGSATEANNLALRGVVKSYQHKPTETCLNQRPKLIVSAIEHKSVLETARDLEKEGVEIVILPVNKEGLVDLEKLKAALDEKTVLVSVMYVNNEIGTIQPIAEISKILEEFRHAKSANKRESTNGLWRHWQKFAVWQRLPLFHTDAVQAPPYLDCDVDKLGVDLMTLSGHKIYGPKGIGALYTHTADIKQILSPLITGGGQEFGLRSGTESVPSIVGFAKAVELAAESREEEKKRIGKLRDYFWEELKKIYSKAEINGIDPIAKRQAQSGNNSRYALSVLPNILNVYFPGRQAADLLVKFDRAGIAVSAGSACRSRSPEPSHVLKALGMPLERVKSSLRFSLGRLTTQEEIKEVLEKMRSIFYT